MEQRTVLFGIDLGTSATTANYCTVRDSRDSRGNLVRQKGNKVTEIKDWPGCDIGETIGNICVPTDLIYNKNTRELLYWGFEAKRFLDADESDPFLEIKHDQAFHVEHIKLLIPDPDRAKLETTASARYRDQRKELIRVLGKQPHEVFRDFINRIIEHIVTSANSNIVHGLGNDKIELVLAFPSGWDDYIHTMVAEIGARAVEEAIHKSKLKNIKFGIENVYTVSETLCGVKEWFRDAIAEAASSDDLIEGTNLDELKEGECFLPCDIGGGTGCITPLKLVSKHPLRVDQLGPTQSLEVSGEAVEAEFEKLIRGLITKSDYPKDLDQLISKMRRKFKEEKKFCGEREVSKKLSFPAKGIRANQKKGFERGFISIEGYLLENCFDNVIEVLERALGKAIHDIPEIKTVVFLGQFGGNSKYLRKKMATSKLSKVVTIRHSQSGKLNVVKGAISERFQLNDNFVRKFQTLKSYGTLVTMEWTPGSKAHELFPTPGKDGAVPFEREHNISFVKVIEWAIPKGTVVENEMNDVGSDGRRFHTWPLKEKDISFNDTIVISDESPPSPQSDGTSLTLWTKSHENNQLYHNNQRLNVQRIDFSWNLAMSEKLDGNGRSIGPYDIDDLEEESLLKRTKNRKYNYSYRKLEYELMWTITEMQVKVHIRPLFPGFEKHTAQLAEQLSLSSSDKVSGGESRSKALKHDIKLVANADPPAVRDDGPEVIDLEDVEEETTREPPMTESVESAEAQLIDETVAGYNNQWSPPDSPQHLPAVVPALHQPFGYRDFNSAASHSIQHIPEQHETFGPGVSNLDSQRSNNCYICKLEKERCNCSYTPSETTKASNRSAPSRRGKENHINNPIRGRVIKPYRLQRKEQIKLGKRKEREESKSPERMSRDRSMTLRPDFNESVPSIRPSIESMQDAYNAQPVAARLGRPWTAVRGGKHGSKHSRY